MAGGGGGRLFSGPPRPAAALAIGLRPQDEFPASLKLAGLIDAATVVRAPRSSRVRAGSYFISEQACFDGIREVAERLGRSPRVAEHIRERDSIIAETEAAGTPRTILSYNTIPKRWPVWDEALIAADLEPLGGRATGKVGARKERKAHASARSSCSKRCRGTHLPAAPRLHRADARRQRIQNGVGHSLPTGPLAPTPSMPVGVPSTATSSHGRAF